MELPNFRSIPLLVVGIPVVRAKCCFACVMPKALLQEKKNPGIRFPSHGIDFYFVII